MSANESDDDDLPPIRSKEVTINDPSNDGEEGCRYTFKMELHRHFDYEYNGQTSVFVDLRFTPAPSIPSPLKKRKGEEGKDNDNIVTVGHLQWNILKRPCQLFHQTADEESGTLQGLACLFCEPNGTASRIAHPALQDKSPGAVRGGGFFHVESFRVNEPHKGNDLGLRMIHETLVFLDDLWTIAVMDMEGGDVKIQRYVGRMGFLQAGRDRGACDAWFLTREVYFSGGVKNAAIERWIPKDQSEEVEVYTPPLPRQVSGLDEELKKYVSGLFEQGITPPGQSAIISDLVERGASIENSCVMHMAAANTTSTNMSVLETLVLLDGDVNATDENGSTPLHIAAAAQKAAVVQHLLANGANAGVKDLGGKTPLETFFASLQSSPDMFSTFGLGGMVREIDVIPKLETAKALMAPAQRSGLIGGWMPLRMRECLETTVAHEVDEDYGSSPFTRNQPTPLVDVCRSYYFSRIEYIPMNVLKSDPRGLFKSFNDAWKMIFRAIWEVLKRTEVPTLSIVSNKSYVVAWACMILVRSSITKTRVGRSSLRLMLFSRLQKMSSGMVMMAGNTVLFKEEIEAHPETPLGKMYDVARYMCFNHGGGTLERPGPHRDVSLYELLSGQESDESDELDW